MKMDHNWIKSTLGHGILMCRDCKITILEASAIGMFSCKPIKEKKDE